LQPHFLGLSPTELKVLQGASYNIDFKNQYNGKNPQDPENSFIHSMRNGTTNPMQTVEEAQGLTNEFICGNEGAAMSEQMQYMDSSSPSHAGFQAWSGVGTLGLAGLTHLQAERTITPDQLQVGGKAVQQEFQNIFGDAA
jgi:hypothetical protein